MENILYTKYNKLRRPEFRISTMICESDGHKTVVKKALTTKARKQIDRIYKNSMEIGKAYNELDILLPEYREDRVIFEYLNGHNLESMIVSQMDDVDELIEIISNSLDRITDISDEYKTDFFVTDSYREVFGDIYPDSDSQAYNFTNIDVLFDNIIIKERKYICLDCEWVFHFPIPVKFVRYRSLFYFFQKYEAYLKKWTDFEGFFKIFDIAPEETTVFMEMERNFQMYVTGKDFENDYVYKYEKECLTMDEAFVDRRKAEEKIEELENLTGNYRTSLENLQKNLEELTAKYESAQNDLVGKYAHVKHLESIVVDKSHVVDQLNKELILKEQHVQNLTAYIDEIYSSKWFKVHNKFANITKDLRRK